MAACVRVALAASVLLLAGQALAQTGSVISSTYTSPSAVTIQPGADSTAAVQVLGHSGTSVLAVDTTNNRVGIGSAAPQNALVVGTETIGSTAAPASTIEIGNTLGNSVLTMGTGAMARLILAWNATTTPFGSVSVQSTQPLFLQGGGGPVLIGPTTSTPVNRLVVGAEATGGTSVPGSTIEVGNASGNSVLALGQDSTNRVIFSWDYATLNAALTTESMQALNLQQNGGPVILGGGFSPKRAIAISGTPYSISPQDYLVVFQTLSSTSAATVNLPLASSVSSGQQFIVKDESGQAGTGSYAITITPMSGQTIDGTSGSAQITMPDHELRLYSDGTSKWFTW